MGELIVLDEWRRQARGPVDSAQPLVATAAARPVFFFDLSCPFSYLAAERIERLLGDADWVPSGQLGRRAGPSSANAARERAERTAESLRLPLVWPERPEAAVPGAMRAAAFAAEAGAGAAFALAASRLAFCGGFDLDDPEILAEAAAAAGVGLEACLEAAGDPARDAELEATAERLHLSGVRRLPAIRIGRRWLDGERAPVEAAALMRSQVACPPLAPVC